MITNKTYVISYILRRCGNQATNKLTINHLIFRQKRDGDEKLGKLLITRANEQEK